MAIHPHFLALSLSIRYEKTKIKVAIKIIAFDQNYMVWISWAGIDGNEIYEFCYNLIN